MNYSLCRRDFLKTLFAGYTVNSDLAKQKQTLILERVNSNGQVRWI